LTPDWPLVTAVVEAVSVEAGSVVVVLLAAAATLVAEGFVAALLVRRI